MSGRSTVHRAMMDALWFNAAKDEEKQRLDVISDRLGRLEERRAELILERQKIMRRCIKRMRRGGDHAKS